MYIYIFFLFSVCECAVDPASNEEVYEWNGIWYLTSGAGPVGKPWRRPRWSQEERDGDWRPTVAEEEKYNAWYDAYCPTERYTTETSADKCAYDNAVEKGDDPEIVHSFRH